MPTSLLSALCRLTAGALLFQATAPAALVVKEGIDVRLATKAAMAKTLAEATRPPAPMKGVPTVWGRPSVPPTATSVASAPELPQTAGTILNEVGRAQRPISDVQRALWREELAAGSPTRARGEWLRLWLAEADLAREYPGTAIGRIDALLRTNPRPVVRAVARFDRATGLFYLGRYGDARTAFTALLKSPEGGYSRRNATLWLAHARSCEAYHAANERYGVPNPKRLDPLCAAAALAACLRALALPHDEPLVATAVRHTEEGSTLADVADACDRLGVAPHAVQATEKGLRNLPLPAVAYVEGDHFVSVVAADAKGVEYVCSDCGRWPGGPVRVPWKGWRALKPGTYLTVSRRGSAAAIAMDRIAPPHAKDATSARILARRPLTAAQSPLLGEASRLAARLVGNATPIMLPLAYFVCGQRPESLKCPSNPGCFECLASGEFGPDCPFDPSGFLGSPSGAMFGEPVNLATGEEEYRAPGDLHVYNPIGPSVSWKRIYNSLGSLGSGFGFGWSHPYNVGVGMIPYSLATTGGTDGQVVLENGARIAIHAATVPSTTTPVVDCSVPAGVRLKVQWILDPATMTDSLEVTFSNHSKWVVGATAYTDFTNPYQFRPIRRLVDPVGNWIGFNYATYVVPNGTLHGYTNENRLTSIVDSSNNALLTLAHDSNGFLTSATDIFSRRVYYTTVQISIPADVAAANPSIRQNYQELTQVSQIVPSSSSSGPQRFGYTYLPGLVVHVGDAAPYLGSITVPSPTGTGTSTGYLHYTSGLGFVEYTEDANGYRHYYSEADWNGTYSTAYTTVKVKNAAGTLIRQFTYALDSTMGWTTRKDASGTVVASQSFAGSVFKPSSVTDGNGRTWSYTYDGLGNRLTATTPKSVTTTYGYDYSYFSLGEPTSVTEGSKSPTTLTYYHPSGLLHTVDAPLPGTAGSSSTATTTYSYSSLGNLTQVDSPGNNATTTRTVTLGYTSDGSYSQSECLGKPITATNELGKVWHMRYDARGNVTDSWDPLGLTTNTWYNLADQTISVLAPATGNTGSGRTCTVPTYLYVGGPATKTELKDESGTVVRTANYTLGKEGEPLATTGNLDAASTTYDAAYATKTVTDGNSDTTTYTYDLNGRPSSVAYPLATGTNYDQVHYTGYDPAGNLLSLTDGNGQVKNFTYGDTDGLLTAVSYPGATSNDVSYAYDSYDRMTTLTDGLGYESASYDDGDGVTSHTRVYTGVTSGTYTYTYYPDGSRHTMANPIGTTTYGYDAAGRYVSMSSPPGTFGAAWYDNGWQSNRVLPSSTGLATAYGYDARWGYHRDPATGGLYYVKSRYDDAMGRALKAIIEKSRAVP